MTSGTAPLVLLILDTVGVILAGIGLAEKFANTNLVPESWQFHNYELAMILVGVVLMLPFLLFVVVPRIRSR